jgi:nitrite reductase/ring-hydroxylating ferredoxin subunit
MHAAIENALDVPHTAFLHGGLFRQDRDRRPIDVVIRRWWGRDTRSAGWHNPGMLDPRLRPPETKGQTSVARVPDDWYVACASEALRDAPLPTTMLGTPLVLFRDADGNPGALLDRCPHRNVPLSLGRVVGPHLECGYHGWQFDRGGACRAVPGLCGPHEARGRRVQSFATREVDGYVWVYGTPDAPRRRAVHRRARVPGGRGLDARRDRERARRPAHRVPARGPVPAGPGPPAHRRGHPPVGLVGRILARGDGELFHWDRFILPCIAQVEYQLGEGSHLVVNSMWTPIDDFRTRMFAAITFRLPVPGWTVTPVLKPLAMKIFNQDAVVLARQTETIRQFGGEQFMSTDIDTLGPSILKLLRAAERGDRAPMDAPEEKHIRMLV